MMWPEACFMLLQSSLYSLLDGEQVLFSFWELNKKQYEGFEFYQIFFWQYCCFLFLLLWSFQ